jgi:hypothetical protein
MTLKTIPLAHMAGVLGAIDADAYAAGTYTTSWISAANFQTFLAIVMVGEMASTSTVNAKIQQATSAAGAGAKDLTGAAITQLTQAGTDADKQALISFGAGDLDVANYFTHFRLSMTVATAASDAAGLVLGGDPRLGPASDYDAASVDEVVIL